MSSPYILRDRGKILPDAHSIKPLIEETKQNLFNYYSLSKIRNFMVASEIFLKKGDGDCKEICKGGYCFYFHFLHYDLCWKMFVGMVEDVCR